MNRIITSVFLLLFAGMLHTACAQYVTDREFALVVYGKNMTEYYVDIKLRKNPGLDNEWIQVNSQSTQTYEYLSESARDIYVLSGLASETFVGQDIRENYIALRIEDKRNDKRRTVIFRGAWAVWQPEEKISSSQLKQWADWIHNEPAKMRERSFADIIYPKNRKIDPKKPLVEHIELPVRHLKPGIQEVEWLELLFTL